MQPIVNGLQEQFEEEINVLSLNALDGAEGQAAFDYYGLRGHPTVMLIDPDGLTVWTRTGVTTQQDLEQAIEDLIAQ